MIDSLYKEYFQKSKVFLYPALNISKQFGITPIMTYIGLNDICNTNDIKLICEFHLRNDPDYLAFENKKLYKNHLFQDFYETCRKTGLYIFDLSSYAEDWFYFLNGQYSKLSGPLKASIVNYHTNKYQRKYVESYLNPRNYYDIYAELLGCDAHLLEKVVELCDKPDLTQEHLEVKLYNKATDTIKSKFEKL